MGGQIDALVGYPAEMSPHVQAGRARALTLIGPRRNPFLPDTPLASEAGYRMPDLMTWGGFFVPAGTPAAIVERLNRETVATGESAELKAAIAKTGSELQPYTAREFRTLIEAEIAKWNRLVRESGVKVQ
jgi:tripartite-type tricarboxylate transporter receptor subunit TctC